jgi:hypothetical protein
MLKGEEATMGNIHVCDAYVTPCDDPENQMVVSIGAKGRKFFAGGYGSVERSNLMCVFSQL